MTVAQMREALIKRTKYKNSPRWTFQVNTMSDKQVMAIYFRMLYGGELK